MEKGEWGKEKAPEWGPRKSRTFAPFTRFRAPMSMGKRGGNKKVAVGFSGVGPGVRRCRTSGRRMCRAIVDGLRKRR